MECALGDHLISSDQDLSSPYSSEHILEPSALLAHSGYFYSSPSGRNEMNTIPYQHGDDCSFLQMDPSANFYSPQSIQGTISLYPYVDSVCIPNSTYPPSTLSARHRYYAAKAHYQQSYSYPNSPYSPSNALQLLESEQEHYS